MNGPTVRFRTKAQKPEALATADPPRPMRFFACSSCNELHVQRSRALRCCPKLVTEVWACPSCDKVWSEESEALICCFDEKAALEAAGQLRLPGS